MKNIAASVILIALLAQFGNRYMVILNYELNKNFIATRLCVNRAKPMSGCNGKCYLKRQLEKSTKEAGNPNGNQREDKNEVFFPVELKKITTYFFAVENIRQYLPHQSSFMLKSLCGDVFHPPQVA